MVYSIGSAVIECAVLFALAVVFSLLRYYVRIILVRSFWLDDWFSLLSFLILIPTNSLFLYSFTKLSLGRHVEDPKLLETTSEYLFLIELLYFAGTGLIKISFAITLLRFMRKRVYIVVLAVTIAVVMICSIVIFAIFLFSCSPVQYSWQRAIDPYVLAAASGKDPAALGLKPRGSCMSPAALANSSYAHIGMMLAADMVLGIIMPILLLKDLQMRLSLKISAGILLAIGSLPSAASIARLPYVHIVKSPDVLYLITPLCIWSNFEFSACLIATSASALKPLASQLGIIRLSDSAYPAGYSGSSKNRTEPSGKDDLEMAGPTADIWAGQALPTTMSAVKSEPVSSQSDDQPDFPIEGPGRSWNAIDKTVEMRTEFE